MIAALVAGRLDETKFPGRNTFPLIGRPLMVYPILAARHARLVDRIFVSTDAPPMARIAEHQGVEVLARSAEVSGPGASLEELLMESFAGMAQILGEEPEAVVLLLANAPTVTSGMIDQGIEMLLASPSADAVISVSRHNEFSPRFAQRLADDGSLQSHADPSPLREGSDAYFPDALLWVLRPRTFLGSTGRTVRPNWIVNTETQRVLPLIHEGYGDVDYLWQIPMVEEWLRRRGFSEEATPYDTREASLSVPAAPRAIGTPSRAPAGRRVLITTVPFGEGNRQVIDLLEEHGVDYTINPIGRKLKEAELAELAGDFGALIAGTEQISATVMDCAPHLRLIARVGIGLDGVDLLAAQQRGILVSYTPDAPSPAVAELTIGLMLSLLRHVAQSDRGMRNGVWQRFMGRRLSDMTVGVIGVGRVGKRVIRHLGGFGPRILANDLTPDFGFGLAHDVRWVDKEAIYDEADVITLHIPLTNRTRGLIARRELARLKPGAVLINTSRGGIIDEHELAESLRGGRLGGAAIDVFQQEPYSGELALFDSCVLTAHMGSMSHDCRAQMELGATQEVIRFLRNEPLLQLVPDEEYLLQRQVVYQ